jgi:uncharacterized protein (TIGR03435 family)
LLREWRRLQGLEPKQRSTISTRHLFKMTNTCSIMLLLVATAVPACSQLRFEVASIRPSQPGTAQDARVRIRGDRLEIHAYTVKDILDWLNGYQLHRVTGGPDWMGTDRYDIEAKADGSLEAAPDGKEAIMALLAERFQLQSHRETRQLPAIVLRAPGTPRGLKPAGSDETYSIRMESGDVVLTAVPMATVTNYLSQMWRVPVVDETELKGKYDFRLATSQVVGEPEMKLGDRVREAIMAIGFRVEDRRMPLEVTVVDRCERPSAN